MKAKLKLIKTGKNYYDFKVYNGKKDVTKHFAKVFDLGLNEDGSVGIMLFNKMKCFKDIAREQWNLDIIK